MTKQVNEELNQQITKFITELWYDTNPNFDKYEESLRQIILARDKKNASELAEYVDHAQKCLRSQWRQGRPTEDGGYETQYGYGSNEKWYQRGEYPGCTCGLTATLTNLGVESKEK